MSFRLAALALSIPFVAAAAAAQGGYQDPGWVARSQPRPAPFASAEAGRLDLAPTTVVPVDAAGVLPAAAGNVITTIDSRPDTGCASSIGIGADGLPIISYLDEDHDIVKIVHCGDPACSFGNIVTTIDGQIFLGASTSIVIGDDHLPVIAYSAVFPALRVAHCGDAECRSEKVLTTIAPEGARGLYSSIRIGADGLPVIAYYEYGASAVKVAHCGDPACSQANVVTTVREFEFGADFDYYVSIAIGSDGFPLVAYYDERYTFAGGLEVLRCDSRDCSSASRPTVLDSGPWVGGAISAVIGTDGLALITYGDVGRASLKVAHCGNLDCTSGTTLTTVYPGRGGSDTSAVIGADGLPLISFCVDYAALYVAHCGDAACSSGNTVVAIDSGENVGRFSSIAIGADGLPMISYCGVDATLKVAHCATPTCAALVAPRVRRHFRDGRP